MVRREQHRRVKFACSFHNYGGPIPHAICPRRARHSVFRRTTTCSTAKSSTHKQNILVAKLLYHPEILTSRRFFATWLLKGP